MARMTPQQVADKWSMNAGNAEKTYKAGVEAVTVSPMEKAAMAQDKWAEGVRRAMEQGTFADGLRSVSLTDWKAKTASTGASRYRQGVADAKPKMANFLSQLLPYTDQVSAAIASMPDTTEGDRDARMLAAVRQMRQFKFRKSRS